MCIYRSDLLNREEDVNNEQIESYRTIALIQYKLHACMFMIDDETLQ